MYKIYTNNWDIPDGYLYKIWLIMRLTTVILIATIMQVSAAVFAQKISMVKSKAPLKTVLKELKSQSGYIFLYTESVLKLAKPVDIKVNNADFQDVLELIFENQPLSYTINESTITVKEKAPSLLDKLNTVISNIVRDLTVKGKVTDQDGKPLPNASIRVKGKSAVTNTNQNGEFELKGVDEDAVLLVSYVGFKTLEISLKDAVMPLEIKLNVATGELEEVKVVYNTGYQKIDAGKSTGSFVQIDNELFSRSTSTNVVERIYKVTNGLIFNSSEKNGSTVPRLQIRGISTINSTKDPLIVIDNFPFEGPINALSVNPNDVENITVLKDAAAAAIWGIRAGNGVIVITTKKGKYNQTTKVSFRTDLTRKEKPDLFYIPSISSVDMINFEKEQFAAGLYNHYDDLFPSLNIFNLLLPQSVEILLAARKKNAQTTGYNALNDPEVTSALDKLSKHDVRDDINNYLLRNNIIQQYAFNISGGGNAYNYFGSVGYNDNKENNLGSESQKLSTRFSNSWKPIKNLEISADITYIKSNSESGGADYTGFISGIVSERSPYTQIVDERGNPLAIPTNLRSVYIDTAKYPALLDWHYRPLEEVKESIGTTQSNDIRINTRANYAIIPGLNALFEYQYQKLLINNNVNNSSNSYLIRNRVNTFMNTVGGKVVYPYPLGSNLIIRNTEQDYWNVRGRLSYEKRIGSHWFSLQTGSEIRENKTKAESMEIAGYNQQTGTSPIINNTTNFIRRPDGSSSTLDVSRPGVASGLIRNGSFFALADYSFLEKYSVTGSARIDQANFLGVKANGRRVPLWSSGVAWELSKENFYKISWLTFLKLKATYGYQGNANPRLTVFPTISYSLTPITGANYAQIDSPPLPNLRWERSRQLNLSANFGTINNRISGAIDFYWKRGLDLIQPIPGDPTGGVASYNTNYADMKGKGVDIQLSSLNTIGLFRWNTNLNFSFNSDEITSYKLPSPPNGATYTGTAAVIEGESLYQLRSFKWAGLDPLNGTPRIIIDGVASDYTNLTKAKLTDLVYQGVTNPKFYGNVLNNLSWKQLSISFNISYKLGYNFRRSSFNYGQDLMTFWGGHSDYSNRWQKSGDELITNVPSLTSNNTFLNLAYANSDILVEKGDHFRLEDIQISYDINRQLIRKLPLQSLRISLLVNNLGILWKANRKGLDPDAYRFGVVPESKSFSLSIHANF